MARVITQKSLRRIINEEILKEGNKKKLVKQLKLLKERVKELEAKVDDDLGLYDDAFDRATAAFDRATDEDLGLYDDAFDIATSRVVSKRRK